VVFAGFCAFLTLYAPQPLLPMLSAAFGVPAAAVVWVISASTMAVAMAAPFAGMVADRFGRKRVIVPAAFLLAVPTLFSGLSHSLGQLIFWRFWQGIFTPGIFAVIVAYINEEWEEGAGSAMAAYVTGTVLGGFCGRMLAALLAIRGSWRLPFFVLAGLEVLGGVAMWSWLPAERKVVAARGHESGLRAMGRHLRNRQLLATYAVGMCAFFTLVASFTYVNFHLAAAPFRLGTAALGLVFTVYLVGAAVTPFAGRAIDRMGHRFALTIAFTGAIAGILLTLTPSVAMVMAGLALCCTGVFAAQSSASSYIGTVATDARAAAVGLYVMFYYLGGSLGAALPGLLWSRGGWTACVAMVAGVQVLTIAIALTFWNNTANIKAS
jgi:YNFM family putative membrane transporter